ncbi:PilZ domain-containing protein [Undibacter mobilis]|uniref:PilZ domain-containing protein n=2 Tax=Undibacter mobilis TaxID=2292256 RepID=A0A371B3X5_9BRAD|nr:PilZ domain-containing protein [Undibacter mobilis]
MRPNLLKDRRKNPRHAINRVAQYYTGAGALPRSCVITDISDSGARLYSDTMMPDMFVLSVLVDNSEMRRDCQVVWRLGGELGVRFAGRSR